MRNKKSKTAHNRSVYATGAVAPLASVRLGQSLRSFPRLTPAHFASPGLAAQALIRAGKTSYTAGTLGEIKTEIFEECAASMRRNTNIVKTKNSVNIKMNVFKFKLRK
jgi:hypothetical protein